MASTAWLSTITINTDSASLRRMRGSLRRDDTVVPFRDSDVIAKYINHVLDSNGAWDGIDAGITVTRAKPVRQPWQKGLEQELQPLLAEFSPKRRRQLNGLACCAFGALILLACFVTFAL
ncbi:MAG: hypothetical protein JHD07_09750 [Bradyrhizobium sp.]|uniref:hypothetical protein n=1 Tax=Bradyrhizobium sp. TaxID=376 RepID=UPI001A19DBA5|nr:hypothetical protein [Bradyrhizobium sp.]MBJ7403551.1 hypothetical protein [Bradyrhizobium sp.]